MRALTALLVLLAGCAGRAPQDPQQAACAAQAEDAPAVKELVRKGLGNPNFAWSNERQLNDARSDATLACLRQRGLAPRGGVERRL